MTARIALTLALALATPWVAAREYTIDPGHTMVMARWNHFGFSNPMANFPGATGTLRYDAARPNASQVEVTIPVAQLQSFVPELNAHLTGADFFDAERYPTATFRSTRVTRQRNGHLRVEGLLELHGVKKPVVLDATLNGIGLQPMMKVPAIGFDATTTISRSAFGISKYVPQVSDAIRLQITTEAHAK